MEECGLAHPPPCRYAPGRNRTYDLALRRRALYPLSYGRDAITVAARSRRGDRPLLSLHAGAPRGLLAPRPLPGRVLTIPGDHRSRWIQA
jgi:hypothetical protein